MPLHGSERGRGRGEGNHDTISLTVCVRYIAFSSLQNSSGLVGCLGEVTEARGVCACSVKIIL